MVSSLYAGWVAGVAPVGFAGEPGVGMKITADLVGAHDVGATGSAVGTSAPTWSEGIVSGASAARS